LNADANLLNVDEESRNATKHFRDYNRIALLLHDDEAAFQQYRA
jgi:hypothetical protein